MPIAAFQRIYALLTRAEKPTWQDLEVIATLLSCAAATFGGGKVLMGAKGDSGEKIEPMTEEQGAEFAAYCAHENDDGNQPKQIDPNKVKAFAMLLLKVAAKFFL